MLKTRIAAAAVLGVTALGGSAVALATTGPASATRASTEFFTACVGAHHVLQTLYSGAHTCAQGETTYTWSKVGPRGATGPKGARGPAGPSAVVAVTATTTVTNWPENSGWANDNFTRTVTITRQHAAASSHCGGAPTCWFYTESLSDNGSFMTAANATAPNGSHAVPISGIVSGTMVGGGRLEFYASSGSPTAAGVPATANGAVKPASTTNWYKFFFPAATTYGLATGTYEPWTTYSWVYTAPKSCEQWTDGIVPGDDGQGPSDGNITGINACTA